MPPKPPDQPHSPPRSACATTIQARPRLNIERLLGRDVVGSATTHAPDIAEMFADKRVLVTGAGGSIGSELCRQLAEYGPSRLILVDNSENNLFDIDNAIRGQIGYRASPCLVDTRERVSLARLFSSERPEVVFHAAAYKHVPMTELHPAAAIRNNVFGTQRLCEAAVAHGVGRFVMVSTDKAVNPTNIMGASKRLAEMVVHEHALRAPDSQFVCVRFGNVLGSRGSVLHTFYRQIEAGGPITVTHRGVTRFFMTIPEAVGLLIQAGAKGRSHHVLLLEMGEPVRIYDLAERMIRAMGRTLDDIKIELIGLRPGEKLFEELLLDHEVTTSSGISGVLSAVAKPMNSRLLERVLDNLALAVRDADHESIRRILAATTNYQPTGVPANSSPEAAEAERRTASR
ncbi:MAG: SDR family NAD(P)-dependent oxidoreductase [Nannocystaceae bacterium]